MVSTIYVNWWTGLLVVATIVLLLVSFILKVHELGVCHKMTRLFRHPSFEAALLAFFVGGLVQYGSTKGANGTGRRQLVGLVQRSAPTIVPIAVDLTTVSLPENSTLITNLCFWGIEHGEESVSLGIAWPSAMSSVNDRIDIFGSHRLMSNGWWRLAQLDVSQIGSNAIVELAYADLPTNEMRVSAFYRLAPQDDSDGDGLTDKVEEWVLGTNPALSDTDDDDGLTDGEELELDADWLVSSEFGSDFRGGKGVFISSYAGASYTNIVHIRGNNPTVTEVEAVIGTSPWYVRAIAKRESGRQSGRYYCSQL